MCLVFTADECGRLACTALLLTVLSLFLCLPLIPVARAGMFLRLLSQTVPAPALPQAAALAGLFPATLGVFPPAAVPGAGGQRSRTLATRRASTH